MDIFSFGCVMHYCLTGGAHPFGGNYERDTNIMRGSPNLSALASSPEATNLVGAMLSKAPVARPTMGGVLAHPFWWGLEQRLQFLVDVSDRWALRWTRRVSRHARSIAGRLRQHGSSPAASMALFLSIIDTSPTTPWTGWSLRTVSPIRAC